MNSLQQLNNRLDKVIADIAGNNDDHREINERLHGPNANQLKKLDEGKPVDDHLGELDKLERSVIILEDLAKWQGVHVKNQIRLITGQGNEGNFTSPHDYKERVM